MLTTEDKREVRMIVREEIGEFITPLDQRIGRLEILFEKFEHDIRGVLADIKSVLDDAVNLRPRIEVLEADVNVLKKRF